MARNSRPKPSLVGVAVLVFNAYRHSESKDMERDRDRHIPTSFSGDEATTARRMM